MPKIPITREKPLAISSPCWPIFPENRWVDIIMTDWLDKNFPGQVTLFNEGVGASAKIVLNFVRSD
jgi:hypothetical protein